VRAAFVVGVKVGLCLLVSKLVLVLYSGVMGQGS
jgi:hypothetical protein